MIDEARDLLKKAKYEYQRRLKAIDGKLRVAVSQDPKRLKDALAVQAEYGEFEKAALSASAQPLSAPEPVVDVAPKREPKPASVVAPKVEAPKAKA